MPRKNGVITFPGEGSFSFEKAVSIGPACAVCGDDDEVLLQCSDGQSRCPPCCADAGWCLSCASKLSPRTTPQNRELSLCNQCGPH